MWWLVTVKKGLLFPHFLRGDLSSLGWKPQTKQLSVRDKGLMLKSLNSTSKLGRKRMAKLNRRFWTVDRGDEGKQWSGSAQFGRVEVGFHLYKHTSHLPDRWVLQPWVRFDRKALPIPTKLKHVVLGGGEPAEYVVKMADPELERLLAMEDENERRAQDAEQDQWTKRMGWS